MRTAFYFQHDYNAHTDEKIIDLWAEHGWHGYGLFWRLLELLAENNGYLEIKHKRLAALLQTDGETIRSLIEDYSLFEFTGNTFYSSRLLKQIEYREQLSKAGKRGAESKWRSSKQNGEANGGANGDANSEAIGDANGKGEERRGKESRGDESKGKNTNDSVSNLSEKEKQLNTWFKENYPFVSKLNLPKPDQMTRLKQQYGERAVFDTLEAMDNYKGLEKKYRDAYKTLNNWLKNRKPTKDHTTNNPEILDGDIRGQTM